MQNADSRNVSERGPRDSVELPLGKLSPGCVPSCPNALASRTTGWDRKSQRWIWNTFG